MKQAETPYLLAYSKGRMNRDIPSLFKNRIERFETKTEEKWW